MDKLSNFLLAGSTYKPPALQEWTNIPGTSYAQYPVAWKSGSDIYLCAWYTGDSTVKKSTDNGYSWQTYTANVPQASGEVTTTATSFNSISYVRTNLRNKISSDNITWTLQTNNAAVSISTSKMVEFNGSLFDLNSTGVSRLAVSTWSSVFTSGGISTLGLAKSSTAIIVVGNSGLIYRSTNGTSWVQISTGISENILGICYGLNSFLIYTSTRNIYKSTDDGLTWTLISQVPGVEILTSNTITYFKNVFLLVTVSNVYTSASGISWSSKLSAATGTFGEVFTRIFNLETCVILIVDQYYNNFFSSATAYISR